MSLSATSIQTIKNTIAEVNNLQTRMALAAMIDAIAADTPYEGTSGTFVALQSGNFVTSLPGLGIGSTAQNVANVAFTYKIGDVIYSKAAVTAGTALSGDDIPESTYGAWRLEIGADGTVDIIEAAANATGYASAALAIAGLPALSANHASMGTVTAISTSGVFDPGTTALSDADTTDVYTDGDTAYNTITVVDGSVTAIGT